MHPPLPPLPPAPAPPRQPVAGPPVALTPAADPPPAANPPRKMTVMQAYVDAWCTEMGLDWRTIPSTAMGMLTKYLKEMRDIGVTVEELPTLIAYHRRTREYLYRRGTTASAKQVSEVVAEWRAKGSQRDPDLQRRLDAIDAMAETLI